MFTLRARGRSLKSLIAYFAVDLLKLKVTANLNPADSVVHFDLSALSSALNRETDWYLKLSNEIGRASCRERVCLYV